MNIQDRAPNRPKLLNTSHAFDDRTDEMYEKIEAVFFDPWNAVQYATSHFGVNCMVQLSTRKI